MQIAVPRSNRSRMIAVFLAFSLPIEHSARPLLSAGHPPTAIAQKLAMASSGEDAGENDGPQATVPSTVALRRPRMRPSFMQRPDPRAFRQYLRTLALPSLRPGGTAKEGGGHLALCRVDRARLALLQLRVAIDRRALARKELLFLQHKRRAARCLRDDLWRWGIGEVKKTAEKREWGEVLRRSGSGFRGVSAEPVAHWYPRATTLEPLASPFAAARAGLG